MRAAALTVTILVAGCGDAGVGTLPLSWSFADGRRCDDAATPTVTLFAGARAFASFACADGRAPSSVMLPGVSLAGADLDVVASSLQGRELYRGKLHTDGLPPSATVTLYATFSR